MESKDDRVCCNFELAFELFIWLGRNGQQTVAAPAGPLCGGGVTWRSSRRSSQRFWTIGEIDGRQAFPFVCRCLWRLSVARLHSGLNFIQPRHDVFGVSQIVLCSFFVPTTI